MRNFALLFVAAFMLMSPTVYSQSKPVQPSIMVIPSDALLDKLGCITTRTNNGVTDYVPEYNKAFVKDPDLIQVISKIGELFSDRGFALLDMSQTLKSIQQEEAEDMVRTSRSGASVSIEPLDKVLNVARPDIILELTYDIKQAGGPMRSVSFNLTAKDAYTRNQIAAASGVGPNSTERIVMRLVEEAVLTHVPNLQSQMRNHFNDILANGREIYCRVQVYADAGIDMEYELGSNYDELGDIIYDWVRNNSVNRSSHILRQTRNEMRCSVRIPLFSPEDRSNPYSAYEFARGLRSYLRSKYGVSCENATQGIGDAHLVVRGKR